VTGQWFSLVSFNNKTDHHDIAEILLKVALNTIWDISNRNIVPTHIAVLIPTYAIMDMFSLKIKREINIVFIHILFCGVQSKNFNTN
jgi:hypothetical protein